MKKYKMIVHYCGAIEYEVEANSDNEAKEKAMALFADENDAEILNGISGGEVTEDYE